MDIESRFPVPLGFERSKVYRSSFGDYLRHLPLRTHGSIVQHYDGSEKSNEVYHAVVDMDLDAQDLQQCADAVMRLRGEYLFEQKAYDRLHFNFLSDGKPRYFREYASGDLSYKKFRRWMKYIFAYANTASLRDEMQPKSIADMQIGDVFIQKGRPYGHAVIVVDMCEEPETGKKMFMLAQSYMPAQDTQILKNPMCKGSNPWYTLQEGTIETPEWTFHSDDLRTF